MRELAHVGVVEPAEERVFVLHRGDARRARLLREAEPCHRAPGAFVRQPEGADLARRHDLAERLGHGAHVVDRAGLVLAGRVEAPVLAEVVGAAVGPVELVEVDPVGPETAERGVDAGMDGFGRHRRAAADLRVAGACDLGGEDDVVPPPGLRDPGADDLFRPAHGFGQHRVRRIHLGRVEEIDAVVECEIDLGVTLGLGILAAPCHGPEAELRNLDPRPPERRPPHACLRVR